MEHQGDINIYFKISKKICLTYFFFHFQVIQYGCESPVRAPKGCDQFYYGKTRNNFNFVHREKLKFFHLLALGLSTGTVESFNYNNGQGRHLANQVI